MFEDHLLPARARLIHIGPPKTGTTALQHAFHVIRDELHRHGVHYAGDDTRPKKPINEILSGEPAPDGPWQRLADEVHAAGDQRVCISNEMMARFNDQQAERAIADLGRDDAHVVLTMRPLAKLLPSQWQQRVRKGYEMHSYSDWLRIVLGDDRDHPHHRHFWAQHGVAAQLERWTALTSVDRMTLLVADEADRNFLPRVFEGLLGLPEGLLVPPEGRTNRSLDQAEADLLRSLDVAAEQVGWDRSFYISEVKDVISSQLRSQPRDSGVPIALPTWAVDRVTELNEERIALLEHTDLKVIGDPALLRTGSGPVAEDAPVEVPTSTAVSFTVAAVEAMRRRERRQRRRIRRTTAPPPASAGRAVEEASGRELARELVGRAARRLRR